MIYDKNFKDRVLKTAFFCFLIQIQPSNCGSRLSPKLAVRCDVHALYIYLKFDSPFNGSVYAKDFENFLPCRYSASKEAPREVLMILRHPYCGNVLLESPGSLPWIQNTIVIRYHNFTPTKYDRTETVYCKHGEFFEGPTDNIHMLMRDSPSYQRQTAPVGELFLDLKLGLEFFGENHTKLLNASDSLLLIVKVKHGGHHQGVRVRDCVAHNDEVLKQDSVTFTVIQSYCENSTSEIVNTFTMENNSETGELVAYTKINDISLKTNETLYISCSIRLCKHTCEQKCFEKDDNQLRDNILNAEKNQINKIVTHKITKRSIETVNTDASTRRQSDTKDRLLRSTIKALAFRLLENRQNRANESSKLNKRVLNESSPINNNGTKTTTKQSHSTDSYNENADEYFEQTIGQNPTLETVDITYSEEYTTNEPVPENASEAISMEPDATFIEMESKSSAIQDGAETEFSTIKTELDLTRLKDINKNETTEFFNCSKVDKSIPSEETLVINKTTYPKTCVPKMQFIFVSILLGIVVCLLFIVSCGLYLQLRREKKRRSLDSFLLYSFN